MLIEIVYQGIYSFSSGYDRTDNCVDLLILDIDVNVYKSNILGLVISCFSMAGIYSAHFVYIFLQRLHKIVGQQSIVEP